MARAGPSGTSAKHGGSVPSPWHQFEVAEECHNVTVFDDD